MANRKKRLKKGIESLQKQIKLHEQKLKQAEKEGLLELAGCYEKEIKNMKKYREKKEKSLKK